MKRKFAFFSSNEHDVPENPLLVTMKFFDVLFIVFLVFYIVCVTLWAILEANYIGKTIESGRPKRYGVLTLWYVLALLFVAMGAAIYHWTPVMSLWLVPLKLLISCALPVICTLYACKKMTVNGVDYDRVFGK